VATTIIVQNHDWLDYVQGVGGLVAALIAIGVAVWSATQARNAQREATRTADAAEQTAAAARQEVEMMLEERHRKPDLRIDSVDLHAIEVTEPDRPGVVFQIGMRNYGDLDAEDVVLAVMAPQGSEIRQCESDGSLPFQLPVLRVAEAPAQEDEPIEWVYVTPRVTLRVQRPTVSYLRVRFPTPGWQQLKVKLDHPLSKDQKLIRLEAPPPATEPGQPAV
jgi:hypothetical protein